MKIIIAMLCCFAGMSHAQGPVFKQEERLKLLLELKSYLKKALRVEKVAQESASAGLIEGAALAVNDLMKTREITSSQRAAFLVQILSK